jgi:hypothetical protein
LEYLCDNAEIIDVGANAEILIIIKKAITGYA